MLGLHCAAFRHFHRIVAATNIIAAALIHRHELYSCFLSHAELFPVTLALALTLTLLVDVAHTLTLTPFSLTVLRVIHRIDTTLILSLLL